MIYQSKRTDFRLVIDLYSQGTACDNNQNIDSFFIKT